MTFSAKAAFLANKDLAAAHRQHMASSTFQAAAQAALQHFADFETQHCKDPAASFHRIAASREFLGVLLNLGEVITVPPKPEKNELNYRI
jgi:hypothetical protein